MISASTTALKWHLDGGSLNLCQSMKTNTQRSSGTSPSPHIVAHRPDVFLQDNRTRQLYLIEMAVAWDSPGREKSQEAVQVWGTLRRPERTVPWLPFGHCGSGYRGPGYGHSPSGGRLSPPPYYRVDCVTDHRNAVLCVAFCGTNPEKPLVVCELAAWTLVGSAAGHQPARTPSLPALVTRGDTQNHFYDGLERQSW